MCRCPTEQREEGHLDVLLRWEYISTYEMGETQATYKVEF